MADPSNSSAERFGYDDRLRQSRVSPSPDDVDAGPCPDRERRRQGLVGALAADEQADFERHVLRCAKCLAAMEQVSQTDTLVDAIREYAPLVERLPISSADAIANTTHLHSTGDASSASQAAKGAVDFGGNERFRIDRKLGAGGMGAVYQAYDRKRDELVALKVLHGCDDAAVLRLTREFRTLADLTHPNLVSLYELYATGAVKFFTMELIDGCDFLKYVRGQAGSAKRSSQGEVWNRLRKGLVQLAAGLEVLHAAGKLHRDIKPSNVLVAKDERVVLVDFGVASEIDLSPHLQHYLAGTTAYMSPEQAARGALSPASDWYSVGVMLFQSLTEQLPYSGTAVEVIARKQCGEPPRPGDWAPDLPPDLESLCTDLLRAQPEQRPVGSEVMARLSAAGQAEAGGESRAQLGSELKWSANPSEFVGRAGELDALQAAFETVSQGRATMVRITGPSGVGKTALGRKFVDELTARRTAIVLEGRCYEREILAFKAADQLIDSLASWLKAGADAELLAGAADELAYAARLFPTLRRVPAIAEAVARTSAAAHAPEMKEWAFAALRDLLSRMTGRLPAVLFVDDLQWGDADSPALFAELLRGPSGPRVLFLAAFRDESEAASPWLQSWRDQEREAGFAWSGLEVKVGALPPHDARELAVRLLPNSARSPHASGRVETIARESAGHPLFIQQLLSSHTSELASEHVGPAFQPDGRQAGKPDLHVEGSQGLWEQSLWWTIEALPGDAYRLLEAAAVAGYPLSLDRALRAAAGTTSGRERVNVLARANLLRTVGAEPQTRLVVYHDRIRETLVSRLTAEEFQDAHRRLASAASEESSPDAESLVLHYQGAGELTLAMEHAVRAADKAAGMLAFDLAIRCYRLALELLPVSKSLGDSAPGNEEHHRELRLKLAEALANAGRDAEAAAEYLAAAGNDQSEHAWTLRRQAGEHLLRAGRCREALQTLEPVFRRYGLRPPTEAAWRLLSVALATRAWLRLTGYRAHRRSSRPATADEFERSDLCCKIGGLLTYFDALPGFALIAQGVRLALGSGDPPRVASALAQEACFAAAYGKTRRAIALLDRAEPLARDCGNDFALACALHARGMMATANGNWRQSLVAFEAGQEITRRSPGLLAEVSEQEFMLQYPLVALGDLQSFAKRVSERLYDAVQHRHLFAMAACRSNLATMAWLASGQVAEARRQAAEALSYWPGTAFQLPHFFELTSMLRIDLYAGDERSAWERANHEWKRVARSGLLGIRFVAADVISLRAACGLAVVASGVGGRPALRTVEGCAKRLERERAGWTTALARLIRAGVLAVRGESAAAAAYRRAAESLDAAELPLYAAAARLRLGELLGDRSIVAEAEASLARHGVAEPNRMAQLLAPDCRTRV